MSYEKKLLLLKLKITSEIILSVFSKYQCTCLGFIYIDPISQVEKIVVLNLLGLIIPYLSHIPLSHFLERGIVSEMQCYDISQRETIEIHNLLIQCENGREPEKWVKYFIQKYWLLRYKEKNPFLKIMALVEKKTVVRILKNDSNVDKAKNLDLKNEPDNELKGILTRSEPKNGYLTRDWKNEPEDNILLKNIWPYISKLLFTEEYRFASFSGLNEATLIDKLSESIFSSKIPYKELKASKHYKNILPSLEKNKAVILEVSPCQSIDTVCENFEILVQSIKDQVQENKPVEIHFNQWIDCINQLLKANGRDLIPPIQIGKNTNNVSANLIISNKLAVCSEVGLDSMSKMINVEDQKIVLNDKNKKEYRIYNHMTDIPALSKEEREELLLFINAISSIQTPYQHIQSALVSSLAEKSNQ